MKSLSERIAERVAAVDQAKQEKGERMRREEEEKKRAEVEKSTRRSQDIATALRQDLSDDRLFDLISTHVEFINDRHTEIAEISYYNPDTDHTTSSVKSVFDRPILFAIERSADIGGKLHRVPIKILSAFLYLREVREMHVAIRSTEIQQRLRDLASANINIKFVQRGGERRDPFAGRYVIEITYRPTVALKATA